MLHPFHHTIIFLLLVAFICTSTPATADVTSLMATLPVEDMGRIKPMDTWARETLRFISEKDHFGKEEPILTIAKLLTASRENKLDEIKILRIRYYPLAQLLQGAKTGRYGLTSLKAVGGKEKLQQTLMALSSKSGNDNSMQEAIQTLASQIDLLLNLDDHLLLFPPSPLPQAMQKMGMIPERFQHWNSLSTTKAMGIPAYREEMQQCQTELYEIFAKLAKNEVFPKETVLNLQKKLGQLNPEIYHETRPLARELLYNRIHPFTICWLIYIAVFLLQLFLSITKNEKLKFLKLPTLLIAFIAHTIALGFWTSIAGRLPLSNTWEYFVSFVWGAVLLGILFEAKLKTGIFPPIVALLGAGGLIAAQSIPIARDITPMMPILRSNWLTYHVVTIMFGYGAMLVAFGIALWYLFLDYSGKGRKETLKQLDDHIYKIIQLGFLFLTIGIATGSIWAAYSWGRYWGWDPKEVWSAITWMIYGIYLHLRTDKRFLGRKSAIMAIIGFICILFTYFGVNYLLSGLHSYGK